MAKSKTKRSTAVRVGVSATLLAAAVGAVVAGVSPGGTAPALAEELPNFDDCAELESFYARAAAAAPPGYGLDNLGGGVADAVGRQAAAPVSAQRASSEAVGSGATGTNLQEQGVDEPDLAKTDGKHVVTVTGRRLTLVSVEGDSPRRLGGVQLPDQYGMELLLVGNRALVLGQTGWLPLAATDSESEMPAPSHDVPAPLPGPERLMSPIFPPGGAGATVITLVDLADPSAPRVITSMQAAGGYVTARERDGVVRVVTTHTPWGPMARTDARTARTARTAQDWLPQRILFDAAGRPGAQEPLLPCAEVRHPLRPAGLGTVSILTLDPARDDALAAADVEGVAAGGDMVYSSIDRLYVATSSWGWGLRQPDDRRIRPDDVTTRLHAFDVSGRATTSYVGSGVVPGFLLSRWAMSEHEGYLRVATTSETRTESSVYVLAERDGRLVRVGAVSGLGPGESIRAVRWFGDMATVVTFRQTDPLYVLDLADPAAPRVTGELKIPGYSAYLHPIGDGLLLGIGQEGDARGRLFGAQASVFDITDRARPRQLATLPLDGAGSPVEDDSRAFTYLPDRRTAILPVWGRDGRMAVVSVAVGPDGSLRQAGRWSPGFRDMPQRVLPLGDRLAAVSERAVTLLSVDTLSPLARVDLGSPRR